MGGKSRIVEYLLDMGATNVNQAMERAGRLPTNIGAKIVECLLAHGATNADETLLVAATYGTLAIVGADTHGNVDVVKFLVDHISHPDPKNE